jgi:glycine hydroxymethyltransferase
MQSTVVLVVLLWSLQGALVFAWNGPVNKLSSRWRATRGFTVTTRTAHTDSTDSDPDVFQLIQREHDRQKQGIELIASENFVSPAVQRALGSCLTNKYSEGLPGARYYGGNAVIDELEELCQHRALQLFGLSPDEWSVNVQAYSGTPANLAVYSALLEPNGRLMGLDLPSGGHLSHGFQTSQRKVSASSKFFHSSPYHVNRQTGRIDYDHMAALANDFRPHLLIAGASAYSREWQYDSMRAIADRLGECYLMADISHIAGLVATGYATSPFVHCDVVTTTTHKSLRGPRAALIFSRNALKDRINRSVFPGLQGGPHNNQIAAMAVALLEASRPEFARYIEQVLHNAQSLATALTSLGHTIVTNGTDNHQLLLDLRTEEMNQRRGALMETLCEYCDISVNKNSLPGDVSAWQPGGVRLGTLAMTTRGMDSRHMQSCAELLDRVLAVVKQVVDCNVGSPQPAVLTSKQNILAFVTANAGWCSKLDSIRSDVHNLASHFPLPSYAF